MSKLSLSPEFALNTFQQYFPFKSFANLGGRLMYLPKDNRDARQSFQKFQEIVERNNIPVTVMGYQERGYEYIYINYNF